ncbi:isoprene synthase, chloroplastic [Cajanus cajan]|uniref:isoprene synthase, chloroplastic n=1 Tax=Cajanus cajan TaxID=3821 RepID=UPI0010FAD8AA|nr:isoprene synthase, chloroplastic [Cajanus cajan]
MPNFSTGLVRSFMPLANRMPDTLLTQNENRRSANYQSNLWTHEFLQSLGKHLAVETLQERATKLQEKVRLKINRTDMEPRSLLEFIDDVQVQRLGLSYKFEEDINRALHRIVSTENFKDQTHKSLHETALFFRILRQHGFHVSQDVFKSFQDEEGKFKADVSEDVQGLLSLYEASYLAFEEESLWEEANAFSRTHLMNLMKEGIEGELGQQVRHVLEGLPYHQSLHRLEARWYIDTWDKKESHNHDLLELAKLDFNTIQSLNQKELQEMSRWWRDIGLASKLNFVRDRLMESFFWAMGILPEPQFANCRKKLTEIAKLVTVLDDIYDVYGTLDELELFTDAVERWDVNTINTLPDYMILCFLALYNTVNAIAYDIFKDRGVKCLPYLKKAFCDMLKCFLKEAKWSINKVIPSFNEYLENAWISSSGGIFLIYSFFLTCQDQDITEQTLHSLTNYHELMRSLCTIFRLSNDLGTSTDEIERGETTNSVLCYLHETGVSEENAREYLRTLIDKAWKNINKYLVMDSTFPKSYVQVAINLARIAQCTYQYGDGFGRPDNKSKSRIESLLVHPVPVNEA